jgi:DNA-binding CsgD family transcriptional regulator
MASIHIRIRNAVVRNPVKRGGCVAAVVPGKVGDLTDKKRTLIRELIDKGKSSDYIANRLDLSRQQVAGVRAWYKHADSWGR